MVVIDASALVDHLLELNAGPIARRLRGEDIHAPHLIDLEVLQAVRRLLQARRMTLERTDLALDDLAEYPLRRHGHQRLTWRIWQLRDNLTAYDAAYVALAESLGCPLLTRDRRLAKAAGASVAVEVP